jgi:hypothetical protein
MIVKHHFLNDETGHMLNVCEFYRNCVFLGKKSILLFEKTKNSFHKNIILKTSLNRFLP